MSCVVCIINENFIKDYKRFPSLEDALPWALGYGRGSEDYGAGFTAVLAIHEKDSEHNFEQHIAQWVDFTWQDVLDGNPWRESNEQ